MTVAKDNTIRRSVREHYARAAKSDFIVGACGCGPSCGGPTTDITDTPSLKMGYSKAEIEVLPEGTDLGLGCGNPGAFAALKEGETVLDLGSGAGIDCLLAAQRVGDQGRVIGVDMTPEMIHKARANAARVGMTNIEFRLGEIEHLPVESGVADVIISNCVINLSPDKPAVYREAFRVLKSGGRLAISDVVATKPVPESIRSDLRLWSGCAAGALVKHELERLLGATGFKEVRITPHPGSEEMIKEWAPETPVGEYFVSANIEAVKP